MTVQPKTSLDISHSHIAAEWDTKKNKRVSPNDVTADSHRRAWWICNFGHEEFNPVRIRVRDDGCARCKSSRWKKEMEMRRIERLEMKGSFTDLEHHPEKKLKEILKIDYTVEETIEVLVNPKVEARIFNSLKRRDINTVEQILELNFNQLCRIRNLGEGSIKKLYKILKEHSEKNDK